MADPQAPSSFPSGYPSGDQAALRERVARLDFDQNLFRKELHDVRENMATKGDLAGISATLNTIASKQDNASRPQWQAYGVMLAAVGMIGALAYWPIRESVTDIKDIVKQQVPRQEHMERWRQLEASDDRTRLAVVDLQRNSVPRDELNERRRQIEQLVIGLQRQIDEQRRTFGDTYSLRDVIASMQRKQDDLERELRALNGRPAPR